ncbi:hypothetical protein, partial [Legionella geestiana]|uniref:hypothetical protein n=1 Tax=Legionella geestiana TaxID=45065 RepID=UPI001A93BD5B
HRVSPLAGCLLRASCPALISAGYRIVLIIYNCAVGWVEHSEARHRVSPLAGRLLRASCPALISAGYGAIFK